ncbi:hypothetical protein PFISCL1PPCAC_25213, partial [Pristionchus fissidentatus]
EESELKKACREFCDRTTLHGLPMVLTSKNMCVRTFWVLFWLTSVILCTLQCTSVFQKYNRREKIVSVELDAFHQAVTYSADAHSEEETRRKKRSFDGFQNNGGFRYVQYEPVLSNCECNKGEKQECRQKDSVPESLNKSCICNFDREDSSTWPCYDYSTWREDLCPDCNDGGYCNLPSTAEGNETLRPCLCNLNNDYCLLKSVQRLRRIWEFRGKALPKKGSPFRQDFLKQLKELGYENMTDQVAITTQTKEKLILKMAALPVQRRIALSYGKSEFIKMCSFNGNQCDIEKDFKLYIDHTFGNCYTFNANPARLFTSSRAGPSYGLRLMVFVNASDYLPTTDAVGVRIAIHGQKENPFPDTFGYSAPTGIVSSFGLSLRKVNRLNNTDGGRCVPNEWPLDSKYIYKKYEYEPEGCYKSCYQDEITSNCKCYDPRLPTINDKLPACLNATQTTCLLDLAVKYNNKKNKRCHCLQPCQQDVYSTTYSAAKWPSGSVNMACDQEKDCHKYYREHAAMLEIYYEQMSYEIIRESQSYQMVNVLSDIGGQAGLWLGASVLTAVEFISLLMRLLKIFIKKYDLKSYAKKRKATLEAQEAKDPEEDLNRNYQQL